MEKMNFSIGCAPQTVGQRAERDTYFKHTPIALQLMLVSIFSSVPFRKSGRSRDLKKKISTFLEFDLNLNNERIS